MNKFYTYVKSLVLALLVIGSVAVQAQTVLISPTGDGGFENGSTFAANGWTVVNPSTDVWSVGNVPVSASGSNCAYVSSTGGTTWAYSQLSVFNHLFRDVTIPAGENKVTLSFKWRAQGEGTGTSDWDNLKIFIGPTSINPTSTAQVTGATQLSGPGAISGMYKLSSAAWNNETIIFSAAPGTYRLIFSWKSDISAIANPPAALDDISLIAEFPASYVWNATSGTEAWNVPTSWTPARNAPSNTDTLYFNQGGNSIATIPAGAIGGHVVFANNTTANYHASAANTLTLSSLTIPAGNALFSNGATAALTLAFSASAVNTIDGRLEINNAGIANGITFANSVTTVTPTGTFAAGGATAATVTGTTATLIVNGTYEHKYTSPAGTIPTATWGANSNCNIIGYTTATAGPSGIGQNFANFTWNCPAQTANLNLTSTSTTGVSGTFSVLSTGTGECRWTGTGGYTVNANNFLQTGGTFDLANGTSGAAMTFNVAGTFNQTGGIFRSTGTSTNNPTLHFNGTANQNVTFTTQPTGPITYRISNPNGITLSGPNADFAIGNGTLGGLRISTTGLAPITFAGITTALSYNAANSTLTYDATGNIAARAIEFPATNGPARLTVAIGAGNVLSVPFSRTISGILTMTSGDIDISANNLTLGTSAAAPGTLTWTAGNIRVTTGSFTRWFGTSGLPTTPGTAIGYFPLAANNNNRNINVYFSTSTALSTGGTITASHSNIGGTSAITPFTDGALTIETRTNSSWSFVTGNGIAASGTIGLRLTGGGALNTTNATDLRLIQASGALGTIVNGGGTSPNFQVSRTGLAIADLAGPHYIGAPAGNMQTVFNSLASGDWNSPSTWETNQIPGCGDVVNILSGHNVTVNSAANVSSNLTINTGGTLTVSSGDLTVGCTNNNTPLTNNGTLTISGGILTVNGNINNTASSTFAQSGGLIRVDGNNGGSTVGSVASGTPLIRFSSNNINLTDGAILIVDPHTATVDLNAKAIEFNTASASANSRNTSSNHSLRLGDGVSTDAGGNTSGFFIDNWTTTGYLVFGSVLVNGGNGTNRNVTSRYQLAVRGNLNVQANSTINLGTSLILGGNLLVNNTGTYINTTATILSIVTDNTGSTLTFSAVPNTQTITNNGIIANDVLSPTANLFDLIVNNTSTGGVTLNSPISVSGTLTLTAGIINTTTTNILSLGTATAAGTLAGGSATSYINGPFARTIGNSNANTNYIAFPVGKTNYAPVFLAPNTTSVSVFRAEAFDSNTGTADASIVSLANNRRWEAQLVSGAFNDINVRAGDANLINTNILAQAPSAAGVYTGAFGSTATFATGTPNTIQSNNVLLAANYTGFLSYAVSNVCSGTPTAGTIAGATAVCSGSGTTLTLSGATNSSGIDIQWAVSPTAGGPYTNLGTSVTQATGPLTADAYYIVTVTCTPSGLSATTAEFMVGTNALPTVSVTPATSNYCTGAPAIVLTATGANTYTWSPAAGLSATTGASVNATPSSTTTYTVTGTDANNCTNTATATVNVFVTPYIENVTATPANICNGGNSQLNATGGIYSPTTVNNYLFSTSTGASLFTLTSPTQAVASGVDDAPSSVQNIGFTFRFEGNNFTQFSVSPDGFIRLGGTAASSQFSNSVISTTNIPKIYPYWDDLTTGTNGNVRYQVTGSAPNRILVVEWFVTIPYDISSAANSLFQAWLYESSGKIEFRYGTMGTGSMTASVGATGASTAPVNYQSITITSNTSSNSVPNNNNAGQPAVGRIYTLMPPNATPTFTWTPATYLSATNISNPVAQNVTATTTYTVVADNNGCSSAPATVTVNVDVLSLTVAVTPNDTVCQGSNITLQSNPLGGGQPYTYSWTGPNNFTSSVQNPGLTNIQPNASGFYVLELTDNCGTTLLDSIEITVHANPIVTVTPDTAIYCNPGTPVALTASGANTYTWSPAAGLSATSGANVDASPTANTNYIVIGTDLNGCIGRDTAVINVSLTPAITALTATPPTICEGESSQLNAIVNNFPFINFYSYATSTGANLHTFTSPTQAVGSGVDDTPSSVQNIGFTFNFEGTSFTQFSVSPDGWIRLGGAAASNQFTNSVISTTNIPKIYPYWDDVATGTNGNVRYEVTGTAPNRILVVEWFVTIPRNTTGAANSTYQAWLYETSDLIEFRYGTMGTGSMSASVGATGASTAPVRYQSITLSTNTSSTTTPNDLNAGQPSVGRMYSFTPPSAPVYSWTPSITLNDASIANPIASPSATETYTVVVTNASGCPATQAVTVNVNPAPVVDLGADTLICGGTDLLLDAGNTGLDFVWNDNSTNQTLLATVSGTYSVTVTEQVNNCSSTDSIAVTFGAIPTVTLPADTAICAGSSVTIDAGAGFASYDWSNNANTQTITVNTAGTYTVTVTNTDGCEDSDDITVAINPLPIVSLGNDTTICNNQNLILNAGAGFASYSWTPSGNTQTITATGANTVNTYSVTVTDNNGCSNTDAIVVTFSTCVGDKEVEMSNYISVYPNPNNGSFFVDVISQSNSVEFNLVDLTGKVIYSEIVNSGNITRKQLDIQAQPAGIYMLVIKSDNMSKTLRISKY